MAIVSGWMPPTRENWELVVFLWQFFPVVTILQYLLEFYPAGKTSIESKLNIPGKLAWFTMEIPGFLTVLYLMFEIPRLNGATAPISWESWLMASLFTVHYINRAIIAPLFLNPTMSPIYPLVWAGAFCFQVINGTCIGGWLAGYGKSSKESWAGQYLSIEIGLVLFLAGLALNILHDDELREIRRAALRAQSRRAKDKGEKAKGVDKVYMIPENYLFKVILYPHYFTEWVEWLGFWVMCGWDCAPARIFLVNEIATMLPRALQGKRWYIRRFGRAAIGNRKAIIPGVI